MLSPVLRFEKAIRGHTLPLVIQLFQSGILLELK